MVKIRMRETVERDLDTLGRPMRRILLAACQEIFDDWTIGKILTDNLTGYRSHRSGVYRIIYKVRESSSIEIVAIGHRKDIYNRLQSL
jgi:mRNA-degrading endonuclease RelE of RelBE toxin-antitoxin system